MVGEESGSNGDESDSSGVSEPPLDQCEPPFTRAPRGHPRKTRIQAGAGAHRRWTAEANGVLDVPDRAPLRCTTCGGTGHNSCSCTRPHN
jgi:hypothetical protein